MAAAPSLAAARPRAEASSVFLVSPLYDAVFFFLAPVVGVLAGVVASAWPAAGRSVAVLGRSQTLESLLLASFVHAHLVLVFFRTHLNREVFRTHPRRFTAVPPLLFAAIFLSPRFRAGAVVLGVLWDIYHSAQQTFGLGRIYDRLQGNSPLVGRTLDRWLNHLVYTAPALAGLALIPQLMPLTPSFEVLGRALFTDAVPFARVWRPWVAAGLIGVGVPFIGFYLWSYARLVRGGYHVSLPKVALLTSTALCSVWTWSVDPFGRAYLINNFFHALQYFGLVAWTERRTVATLAGGNSETGRSLVVLAVFGFGYGILAATFGARGFGAGWTWAGAAFCLTLCVSLLHFWYDGFVWSVRRGQV